MSNDPALTSHARNKRPTLLVLSHLRWDFVFQRPQHLLTRAARDFDVIFVEEPLTEGDAKDIRDAIRPGQIRVVQPVVPEGTSEEDSIAHQRAIVDAIAERVAGRPLILWYYTPMALRFAEQVKADVVVFDKMDELSAFKNAPPVLIELEQRLLERADVVFTGGASMHEAAAHRHANIHCFPSSVDVDHFAKARGHDLPEPEDLAGLPHPRIGFFGVIDERMDLDLVDGVAERRPDWSILMIGPVVKIDPASLPQRPTIAWLGGRSYADLPAYLAHWDMAFMPFAINEATRFISPTKTPEFLAAGLAVASTAIRDVVRPYGEKGLVAIASTPDEMVVAIEGQLAMPDRAAWLAKVDSHLAQGSWDRTWSAMRALIDAARKRTTPTQEEARV